MVKTKESPVVEAQKLVAKAQMEKKDNLQQKSTKRIVTIYTPDGNGGLVAKEIFDNE